MSPPILFYFSFHVPGSAAVTRRTGVHEGNFVLSLYYLFYCRLEFNFRSISVTYIIHIVYHEELLRQDDWVSPRPTLSSGVQECKQLMRFVQSIPLDTRLPLRVVSTLTSTIPILFSVGSLLPTRWRLSVMRISLEFLTTVNLDQQTLVRRELGDC